MFIHLHDGQARAPHTYRFAHRLNVLGSYNAIRQEQYEMEEEDV